MSFVKNDDMRKALSPNRANQTFAIRILPWRARRRDDFLDAHVLHTLLKQVTVDAVAITQ